MPRVVQITLCVLAAWFVLITVAPRRTDRAIFSTETAAIGAMRTIHTMQVQYFSQYGRYAASLKELGPPAGLADRELVSGTKAGYMFTMVGNASGYAIHAGPESFGKTGSRTFYSDQTKTIRQKYGQAPATVNSPELK